MSFILVLPIRSATWWAFGQCTFQHCPWPILDQTQCNVSVLASLFSSVWCSIERPRKTQALDARFSVRRDASSASRSRKAETTGQVAQIEGPHQCKSSDETMEVMEVLAMSPTATSHENASRLPSREQGKKDAVFPLPPPPPVPPTTQAVPFLTVLFGIRL